MLDIKHIDDEEHKKLTGQTNQNILDMARYLSENDKKMWIRHVLVPGITTDEKYLKQLREFIDTLKTVDRVEVLPYYRGTDRMCKKNIKLSELVYKYHC